MSYPPAPPPEDSGYSPDWNSAADLLRALSEQPESQRGARFQEVFQLLRPWLDSAVESLCRRHSLLLDSPATSFALVQGLTKASATTLSNSAKSEVVFQITMQSLALKSVKDEAATWQNEGEAHDAGSWNQFRGQLNSMRQDERATILAALPPITLAQDRESATAIPTAEWLSLWTAATQGIDATALPLEWQRYLEAPPTAIYDKSCESPTIWIPSKNSDFEQELGKELFKASVWTAKENESNIILNPPKWIGSPSRAASMESLGKLLRQNHGELQDSTLKAITQAILAGKSSAEHLPTATSLLSTSADLGFSRFIIEMMHATCLREVGDNLGAVLALERATNHCQSRVNLSNVLSTSAAFKILDGHLDEAHTSLLEALRLAPWSRLAGINLRIVRKMLDEGTMPYADGTHGK